MPNMKREIYRSIPFLYFLIYSFLIEMGGLLCIDLVHGLTKVYKNSICLFSFMGIGIATLFGNITNSELNLKTIFWLIYFQDFPNNHVKCKTSNSNIQTWVVLNSLKKVLNLKTTALCFLLPMISINLEKKKERKQS